jgi:hypothetical protein
MIKENIYQIPRNTFDIDVIRDKIAEFERQHNEIVNIAKNCVDEYDKYCKTQKELLRSRLPALVFGYCKHPKIEWDKNRHEGRSKGFWICADCNETLSHNNWVRETNGGWVTRKEAEMIDKIIVAFFEEFPDIDNNICNSLRC